jgi:rubrerythrin
MTLEEAIRTAISYETRIRNVYREAAEQTLEEAGKSFLESMGDDEQHHLDYLKDRLDEWKKTGSLSAEKLETAIPSNERIAEEMAKFKERMSEKSLGDQKRILSRALRVEVETSGFYRKMAKEMSDEAQAMFARFLEIEEHHIAAVQMQLDYVTKTGYWFDFKEFDME